MPILSFIIWSPIIALTTILLLPNRLQSAFKYITLSTVALQGIALSCVLIRGIEHIPTEQLAWLRIDLGKLGILSADYLVGIDGLNIGFLLLSIVVLLMGTVASWRIEKHRRAYFALYLLMNTFIMGSFLSLDLLLFYMFFEAALLPVYFFIAIWGDKDRERASTQFFLYTLLGAAMILVVVIMLSLAAYDPVATGVNLGWLMPTEQPTEYQLDAIRETVQRLATSPQQIAYTLDLRLLADVRNFLPDATLSMTSNTLIAGHPARLIAFALLAMGFCIKLAAVPFHTWLPGAHVEAPTPISMLLSAVFLKLGSYGLLRVAYLLFPEGVIYYGWLMASMGVTAIVYAALNALAMNDLKKMVAYSSIAHMGFVLLGLASATTEGVLGAIFQMISHGLITTLLFGIADVIKNRTGSRLITDYRGLASIMPRYATVAVIGLFAASGLPGFSGFVGEILILWGAFQSPFLPMWMCTIGVAGVLINASYWVWTIQRMFWGTFWTRGEGAEHKLTDLKGQELIFFVPLIILIVFLGVFPQYLLTLIQGGASDWVMHIQEAGKANLALIFP